MAEFDLVPLVGGDPIHLPQGETVIGRGPFLGVNDKRVSRNHGIIENQDGELRLKPTHLNPLFSQSSPDGTPEPLERDRWHQLQHGDIFSLLPGKHMYKVVAVAEEQGTLRNSQALDEEEILSESPGVSPQSGTELNERSGRDDGWTSLTVEPTVEHVKETSENHEQHEEPAEAQSPSSLDQAEMAKSKEIVKEKTVVSPVPKVRVLPAWMMANVTTLQSPSCKKGLVKKGGGAETPRTSTKAGKSKQARSSRTSSGEESDPSETEQRPRKRMRMKRSDEGEEAQPESEAKVGQQRVTKRIVEGRESPDLDIEVGEEQKDVKPSTSNGNDTLKMTLPESKIQDRKSEHGQPVKAGSHVPAIGTTQPGKKPRSPCPYGKDCYRKNPLHFQECSHPGDSDYEEEEEEDLNRPECPYGTNCYRKNPLHKKEYKHTARPARSTRTIATKNDDDDEDDDLADDDSFINDDSEDIGNDSDYVPRDSDSSGEEDIASLQKEAKAFVRRLK